MLYWKTTSASEAYGIVIKNLGRLTFSRKTLEKLSNLMLQNKEFNLENLKASAITFTACLKLRASPRKWRVT